MSTTQVDVRRHATRQLSTVPNHFLSVTYCVALAGAVLGLTLATEQPLLMVFVGAIICGWSEIDGMCGLSHVSSLTPLRALDSRKRLWLKAVTAYTVGGCITSLLVGSALGLFGTMLKAFGLGSPGYLIFVSATAVLLAARELHLVDFALPQLQRQTHKRWALEFGFAPGAAMWGAHIGLAFLTVIKHGGLFIVAALAAWLDPYISALLLLAFWLGRALPIWIAPAVLIQEVDGAELADYVYAPAIAYRHCAAVGLVLFASCAIVLALRDA